LSGRLQLGVRWLKFNAVGALGIGVQLLALALFKGVFGIHYLIATAMAVETAVLHNFVWHEHWTWRDRNLLEPGRRSLLGRLLRFHLSNGLVSILANVVLMRLFAGYFGLHYMVANLMAIAVTSIANFLLSELFVFPRRKEPTGRESPS